MKRKGQAFTLIELLMVMLIIGIVIAMLMRIGPEVSRNIKIYQTQNFIHVLDLGVQKYNRVYGAFPPEGMSHSASGWTGNRYGGKSAAFGLYLALQGPGSYGWTHDKHDVTAEFGPFLEAGSTNMGLSTLDYPVTDMKPVFIDSFNRAIIYYKARMSNKPYRRNYGNGRYAAQGVSHSIWGGQREADYQNLYTRYYEHFWQKLTAMRPTIDGGVKQVPHNVDSYLIWSSGPDEKFGFWYYDEDELGLMADLQLGTCDDITNFD